MAERLERRYIRRTPQGRLDFVGTLRHIVVEPRSDNELTPEVYLQTLSEKDRRHVTSFIDFARSLDQSLQNVRLAVTAVGSTVRPESLRHHPPEDIDLRVLNSATAGSEERVKTIAFLRDGAIPGYLKNSGVDFEETNCTEERRMVKGITTDTNTGEITEELVPYLDWYNEDPSLVVNYREGLPLQISISGATNYDLDKYLRGERINNSYFSVLLPPSS